MTKMLIVVFLTVNLSLCAVLNGHGRSVCAYARPGSTQVQKQAVNKLVETKSANGRPGIRALYRGKGLATIPSCLEVGDFLENAVRRVNNFNFKNFLDKYDHLIYNQLLRPITRMPPLTASYLVLSTVPAVLSYLFNNNFPFSWMTFDLDKVMKGQVWRLFTPYFLFGQLWLNHYMLSTSALTYLASLELAHINKPEKFIEFLAFGVLSLSTYSFVEAYVYKKWAIYEPTTFENLAFHFHIFVLYFWSRINEGQSVECFNLFSVPAEVIPFMFIAQNFLFHQGGLGSDLAALAFSYAYFTLFSGKKTCPLFKVFRTDALRKLYLKFRDEIPY